MAQQHTIDVIARVHSDFPTKFGIPRQSGLVEGLEARIVFEPAYRRAEAVRGLEEFSHIWLIWQFSQAVREGWSPTVGPVRHVAGADLMDGTPVYDIKPYLPYADAHPEASGGFADRVERRRLEVCCPAELLERVPAGKRPALLGVLAEDPRPPYQADPARVYGMCFAGMEIRFTVSDNRLTVLELAAAPQ